MSFPRLPNTSPGSNKHKVAPRLPLVAAVRPRRRQPLLRPHARNVRENAAGANAERRGSSHSSKRRRQHWTAMMLTMRKRTALLLLHGLENGEGHVNIF